MNKEHESNNLKLSQADMVTLNLYMEKINYYRQAMSRWVGQLMTARGLNIQEYALDIKDGILVKRQPKAVRK